MKIPENKTRKIVNGQTCLHYEMNAQSLLSENRTCDVLRTDDIFNDTKTVCCD